MERHFEFIDGTKKDRATLRSARSHAMKGKNVGKKHHRLSKSEASQFRKSKPVTLLQEHGTQEDKKTDKSLALGTGGLKYQALGDQLLAVSFPVEVSSQSRGIIHQCESSAAYEAILLILNSLCVRYKQLVLSKALLAIRPSKILLASGHVYG